MKIFSPIAPIRCFLGFHYAGKYDWVYLRGNRVTKRRVSSKRKEELHHKQCEYCGVSYDERTVS